MVGTAAFAAFGHEEPQIRAAPGAEIVMSFNLMSTFWAHRFSPFSQWGQPSRRLSFIILAETPNPTWFRGPEFFDGLSNGSCNPILDPLCMTQAKYHLAHETLGDSKFFGNLILGLPGPFYENTYFNCFHENNN